MGIDSPQKRPGTNYIKGSSSNDRGTPFKDPLANNGSGTSSHHKFSRETVKESRGGQKLEGQHLRGYVHNGPRAVKGPIEDVTVAPDGTRRVKDIG